MVNATKKPHKIFHNDGSLWGKGYLVDGVEEGYWVWFRKDGSKLRSGTFLHGKQTGKWTTYDRRGNVYKITDLSGKKSRSTSKK